MPETILSAVIALATIVYTWINYKQFKESKASRLQKLEPCIVPYLQSTADHNSLCLYIKNIGEGCAKNVLGNIIKDYNLFGKELSLRDFGLFKDGVNMFPPQYEMCFVLDTWKNIRNNHQDNFLELSFNYEGLDGRHYSSEHFVLPFLQIARIYSSIPEYAEGQVPYYLKQINNSIKGLQK